ncbi:hypothetical protein [Chondromyces crocatus]|uniref:Uncharacterized protein n=1 Tax=Chondromyces crocatus TaxID=52 RepID=A0A0K1EGB0_CHOCO|nr:hypothetical protein [Chondromyces crocatus]AKT39911.1 uncharacterized protein CMC5_040620 [Chondromyces crocatus]
MTHAENLAVHVAETMVWWTLEKPLVVQPGGNVQRRGRLVVDEEGAVHEPGPAVRALVERRTALLEQAGWPGSWRSTWLPGRFLLFLTSLNLVDGAANVMSAGFYGEFNFPPCDLWVEFLGEIRLGNGSREQALLSWIPEAFVPLAQRGIEVNPEECLGWVEDLAPQLQGELTAIVGG